MKPEASSKTFAAKSPQGRTAARHCWESGAGGMLRRDHAGKGHHIAREDSHPHDGVGVDMSIGWKKPWNVNVDDTGGDTEY
jgi:hypothetical protein